MMLRWLGGSSRGSTGTLWTELRIVHGIICKPIECLAHELLCPKGWLDWAGRQPAAAWGVILGRQVSPRGGGGSSVRMPTADRSAHPCCVELRSVNSVARCAPGAPA